jgi:hypothetical protein
LPITDNLTHEFVPGTNRLDVKRQRSREQQIETEENGLFCRHQNPDGFKYHCLFSEARSVIFCENVQANAESLCSDSWFKVMPKMYNREKDQFSWEDGRESDRKGDTDQKRRQKFRTRSQICADIFDRFVPTREGHDGDAEASRGRGNS